MVVCMIWGSTFVLNKRALAHVGVFGFLTLRFGLAWLVVVGGLVIQRLVRRERVLPSMMTLRVGLSLGVLVWLTYALQTLGLRTLSPSLSGFLTGSSVVMVPLFARFVGTPITRRAWSAVVIALVGLGSLSWPFGEGSALGEIETLGCAVAIAWQIVLTERYVHDVEVGWVVAFQLLVVAAASGILAVVGDTRSASVSFSPQAMTNAAVLWAVLVGGIGATAFAYLAQTHYQRVLPSVEIGVIFNLEPLFALIFALVLAPTPIGGGLVLGGVLILSSMMIASVEGSWWQTIAGRRAGSTRSG
jgi:drug/metabolite transporter (DMT)-like permease